MAQVITVKKVVPAVEKSPNPVVKAFKARPVPAFYGKAPKVTAPVEKENTAAVKNAP